MVLWYAFDNKVMMNTELNILKQKCLKMPVPIWCGIREI